MFDTKLLRAAPSDDEGLFELRALLYGPGPFVDPAYFQWMYRDGPQGPPAPSSLWIGRRGSEIVGQSGGFPIALRVARRDVAGFCSLDLGVKPEARGGGLGARLMEASLAGREVALALELSPAGREIFRRAAWSDLGTLPLWVLPLDASVLLPSRLPGSVRRAAGLALNATFATFRLAASLQRRTRRLHLESVTRFDERTDRVFEVSADQYPVLARRDSSFLNWRFARFPGRGRYQLFVAVDGDGLVGHCVLRIGMKNGFLAGHLVDYFCAPEWTLAMLARAVAELARQDVKAVYCLHLNPVSTRPLQALGFLRRDSGWPFMVRTAPPQGELRDALADRGGWFLTSADGDVDRPRPGEEC